MKLSIVATLYKSAPYLQEFCQRVSAVARQFASDDYEIVLVNDGSPDDSLQRAVALHQQDPHVTVVDLSRNFGHHKAMMAGLKQARGEIIFLIDSDLEEQPEWLLPFAERMLQEKTDVVYGVQEKRRGAFFEQMSGSIFYKAFRMLTGIELPINLVTARVMSRRYVQALLQHQEREMIISGLWVITGFKQAPQIIKKLSSSPTTYSFAKRLAYFVNAVTSFSSKPLVVTFYSGLGIFLTALVFIAHLLIRYVFGAIPPDGYTSIIASIWLFSGLIIFFLGVQGIYISKLYSEVKQRPTAIIRDIYDAKVTRHG